MHTSDPSSLAWQINRFNSIVYFASLCAVFAFLFGALSGLCWAFALSQLLGGEFVWLLGWIATCFTAATLVAVPTALLGLKGANRLFGLSDDTAAVRRKLAAGVALLGVLAGFPAIFSALHPLWSFALLCGLAAAAGGMAGGVWLAMKRDRHHAAYIAETAERHAIAREFAQARVGDAAKVRSAHFVDKTRMAKTMVALFVLVAGGNELIVWSELVQAHERLDDDEVVICTRYPAFCQLKLDMQTLARSRSFAAAQQAAPAVTQSLAAAATELRDCGGVSYFLDAAGILDDGQYPVEVLQGAGGFINRAALADAGSLSARMATLHLRMEDVFLLHDKAIRTLPGCQRGQHVGQDNLRFNDKAFLGFRL